MSNAAYWTGVWFAFIMGMGTLVAAVWMGSQGHGYGAAIPVAYFTSAFALGLIRRR